MMNIIFRSSLFSLYSKYILPSYRNCLTDLSPRYHSLSHPYIQQCKRRFFIVFFPDYFSQQNEKKFYWEWFFILLRMIFHSAENDFSFCWERFTNLQTTNHNNLLIIRYRLNKILRISPKTRKGDLFRTKREKLPSPNSCAQRTLNSTASPYAPQPRSAPAIKT